MSKEFDEREGFVTCEIAIHKDNIPEFETFVKKNCEIRLGRWIIMGCDTCVKLEGEGHLHASIETFNTIAKMEASSNHVKTL